MAKNQIRDGYTRSAYIGPLPGQYEGLAFSYRPMLADQVEDQVEALAKVRGGGTIAVLAPILAKQITEWDEEGEDGKMLPITADIIRRFPHPLVLALRDIVNGRAESDYPRGYDSTTIEEWAKHQISMARGSNGADALRSDQKNS